MPATVQSVHQRLLNEARRREQDFQLVLARYGVERFLYRLSRSRWAEEYVVKGATLFSVWLERPHRPTRDLDVSREAAIAPDELEAQLREVCSVEAPGDGLEFDASELKIAPIRSPREGRGLRARFFARFGPARIPMQIDTGFGDVVTPAPRTEEFPTLLDLPAPIIRIYPRETFIAEKFEAMVRFGESNTRYKDFSDVAYLSMFMSFRGPVLRDACEKTFTHRRTPISPDVPPAVLSSRFYAEPRRIGDWQSLAVENPAIGGLGSFQQVGERINAFLAPLWEAMRTAEPWTATWEPPGPWRRTPRRDGI